MRAVTWLIGLVVDEYGWWRIRHVCRRDGHHHVACADGTLCTTCGRFWLPFQQPD